MANSPHLFTDLKLVPQGKQVEGIGAGLAIEGVGTYVMRIQDDNGKLHEIKIPNSLFLPKLKRCLLSPQHWAQEAKAKGNKGRWSKRGWRIIGTSAFFCGVTVNFENRFHTILRPTLQFFTPLRHLRPIAPSQPPLKLAKPILLQRARHSGTWHGRAS
jgi:hypothetical protein